MFKKLALTVLGLVLVLAGIGGIYALMIRTLMASGGGGGEPPESVAVGQVQSQTWEQTLHAVGSVSPFQGVTVVTEVEGLVRRIAFEAGSSVEAGDLLLELDTEVEQAQLRAAEAAAELAQSNLSRARDLFEKRTISRAELDGTEAALKQAVAQADNFRAIIAKKNVCAPFAGRLGIRQVSLGQFLNKGQAVVSLQALDPVFVEFSLPQQNLGVLSSGLAVRVVSDAFVGQAFSGRLTAINPDIDPVTRSVRLQATLPNAEGALRPGMFVTAEVVLPQQRDVLVVPATAVLHATYGDTVFLIEPGEPASDGNRPLVARQTAIRTGESRGDFIVVVKGLTEGQRIVTNGAFKLRNGSRVIESTVGVVEPRLNPELPNT